MIDKKGKTKGEIGNPRVKQQGMCGNQYSPLHKMISANDVIDGNISTNAYGLCFSRSGSFSQNDRMEIFDSETVFSLDS